jgi:lipopolysaccharide transport system permease protein
MSFLSKFTNGFSDFYRGFLSWRLWGLLAWVETKQRYQRSTLGPFWLTISMAVFVLTIGINFGAIFGQKMEAYLPMLAVGYTFWAFFSATVQESCYAFISGSSYIKQVKLEKSILIYQIVWRNLIIFFHNSIIIIFLLIYYNINNFETIIYLFPGFVLLILNTTWISSVIAIISSRYRDVPQIVASVLHILFYISPILFKPQFLPQGYSWIAQYNPITYMLDVTRSPVLGIVPSIDSWYILGGILLCGWIFTFLLAGSFFKKIVYWI